MTPTKHTSFFLTLLIISLLASTSGTDLYALQLTETENAYPAEVCIKNKHIPDEVAKKIVNASSSYKDWKELPCKIDIRLSHTVRYKPHYSWSHLLWPSTANTHDYLRPTYTGDQPALDRILYAKPNKDTIPNSQIWINDDSYSNNNIRIDNNFKRQRNAFLVVENLASVTCDGPNTDDFYCLGIQSKKHFRILCIDGDNPSDESGERTELNKKRLTCEKKFAGKLNFLSILKDRNQLVFCRTVQQKNKWLHFFTLANSILPETIFNEYGTLSTQLELPLTQPLRYIGRLHNGLFSPTYAHRKRSLFLALNSNNRICTAHIESNKIDVQEKKVMYFDKETNKKQEDFFKLLAVDSCTDRWNQHTRERDAYAFVAVNQEDMVFLCIMKNGFYNEAGKITLRRLPVNVAEIKKIWLAHRTISLLNDQGITTFDFELGMMSPQIERPEKTLEDFRRSVLPFLQSEIEVAQEIKRNKKKCIIHEKTLRANKARGISDTQQERADINQEKKSRVYTLFMYLQKATPTPLLRCIRKAYMNVAIPCKNFSTSFFGWIRSIGSSSQAKPHIPMNHMGFVHE